MCKKRKRATYNSYNYYLLYTSIEWFKWKRGIKRTRGVNLSKCESRWEGVIG